MMADEPENVPAEETKPEPEPKADDRTARSDDDPVDWVAEARKWEKQAKANSDAAARLKELEDAQKTEQQKLTEQLEAERSTARTNAVEAARYRAAMEHGLSKDDLEWLGDDPDQIEDRAERFAARIAEMTPEPTGAPQRRPQERLKAGAAPDATPEKSPEELADEVIRRSRGY